MFPGHSIVLIDPEPLTAFLSERVLQHSPAIRRCEVFTSPSDGLDHLLAIQYHRPERFPQVLLIDATMPEMNGFDFLHQFRQRFPNLNGHTPSIFLLTDADDDWHQLKANAKSWPEIKGTISKPLTLESVMEVCGQA